MLVFRYRNAMIPPLCCAGISAAIVRSTLRARDGDGCVTAGAVVGDDGVGVGGCGALAFRWKRPRERPIDGVGDGKSALSSGTAGDALRCSSEYTGSPDSKNAS